MIPLRDNVPSKSFPAINWLLILANLYVFYLELRLGTGTGIEKFMDHWAVIPKLIWKDHSSWYRLFTAMFLHGGWLHVISNMWFLFIFGDAVEDSMGHIKYAIFYIIAGLCANLIQAFMSPQSSVPMIGASGAIAGVLGAFFFYYPYARVLTLIPIGFFTTIREVPAFFFLGIWFLLQTFSGVTALSVQMATKQSVGGIAWWAHAGGFVSGMMLAPVLGARRGKYR